jgi:glycosyltransferase involved in cell wall biosynthesis
VRRQSPNQGIAATRNHLVREARGDYLWFIDADDSMLPGAIEALRAVVERHTPDLVLCDYRRTNGRRQRSGSTFAGPKRTVVSDTSVILAGLFEAGQLHPWSKISRRSMWTDAVRFPDGMVFEDVAVMPKLASRAATAYHVPDPWVDYHHRSDSIVATMNPRKCVDLARASVEYSADLGRPGLVLTDRALFAARHFAARHFMRAMMHLRGHEDPSLAQGVRRQCLSLFVQALDGQIPWLMRQYLRRGWLWRLTRLRHWIHEASRDSGTCEFIAA